MKTPYFSSEVIRLRFQHVWRKSKYRNRDLTSPWCHQMTPRRPDHQSCHQSCHQMTMSSFKMKMSPFKDIITPSTFLFDAISTNLFICLCILAIEIIVAHIAMVVCMIKYRLYRRRYQSLRDLKKFKGNYSVLFT